MVFKILLLALFALYVVPHGSASPTHVKLSILTRSTDAKVKDDVCRAIYDKEIKHIVLQRQQSFGECATIAKIALALWMDAKSQQKIIELEQQYKDSSAALAACDSIEDLEGRLDCLIHEDAKNKQIQSDLATAVNQHKAKFTEIDDAQRKCYAAANSIYFVKITVAMENLINCFKEPSEPFTEAPVTEAPITEVPITEAPKTDAPLTEAPITEVPITTDGAVDTNEDTDEDTDEDTEEK